LEKLLINLKISKGTTGNSIKRLRYKNKLEHWLKLAVFDLSNFLSWKIVKMLTKLALICLIGQAFADNGQGYYNNNQGQGLGQGYNNQGQSLGQGYNNNQGLGQGYGNNINGGLNQGSSSNGALNRVPGIGQGDLNNNNGYSGNGYSGLGQSQSSQGGYNGAMRTQPISSQGGYNGGMRTQPDQQSSQGTGYYGQARQTLPSDTLRSSPVQNSYSNGYNSDSNAGLNPVPLNNQRDNGYYGRQKRNLGQQTQPVPLGQGTQTTSLGQGTQAVPLGQHGSLTEKAEQAIAGGLGQARSQSTAEALGQIEQPVAHGIGQAIKPLGHSESLTQSSLDKKPELRAKRYAEREPYRKTCNTYYGKYICYRLYEKDSSIPNEFTCWATYLGKQNCTETENVLYLDRRNVEVDPSELDRRFPSDSSSDTGRRDHQRERGRDDEFGAVEQNLHNRRNNERQLPSDNDYRRERPTQSSGARRLDSQVHDNREVSRGYEIPTQSSGSRRLDTHVYDDREVRRQN